MKKKHILIIHPSFCIRAKKQVEALIEKTSYEITIIANTNKNNVRFSEYIIKYANVIPFNFHKNIFTRIKFRKLLKKQFSSVDIIHCHNEPNYHVVDAIKVFSGKIPIIYDIHDLTSMRTGENCPNEQIAYERSDLIIHVSKDFITYGNKLYREKPCHVILSTPSKKYIINNNKTNNINECHFVYQGGIFDPTWKKKMKYSYRNYYDLFKSILDEGFHVHLYTGVNKTKLPSYMILNKNYDNFHFHGEWEYSKLIIEISKYDYGLAGFNFTNIHSQSAKDYLNAALGNKMFDYFCAGLPVITFNANAMSNFVKSNDCGYEKKEETSWFHIAKQSINKMTINNVANKYCMENQVQDLINIYENCYNNKMVKK